MVKVIVRLVMFLWLVTKVNRILENMSCRVVYSPENRLFHIRYVLQLWKKQLWFRHSNVSTHNRLFLIYLMLTNLNSYIKWGSLLYIVEECNTTSEFCKKKKKKKYTPSENLQCQNSIHSIYVKVIVKIILSEIYEINNYPK
jgi:hypothetical protein